MKVRYFTSAIFAMLFATTVAAQSAPPPLTIDLTGAEAANLKLSAGLPFGSDSLRIIGVIVPLAKATAVGCTNGSLLTALDGLEATASSDMNFTSTAVMAPSILIVLNAAKTNGEPVRIYAQNNSGACSLIGAEIL